MCSKVRFNTIIMYKVITFLFQIIFITRIAELLEETFMGVNVTITSFEASELELQRIFN